MSSIRNIDTRPEVETLPTRLTEDAVQAFRRDGFLYLPGLFSEKETDLLRRRLVDARETLARKRFYVVDSTGGLAELIAWSGDRGDLLGGWVRVSRLVAAAQDLLGGQELTHWHSKISFKEPGSEGRWDWHQDYGSWYREGCLVPDMLTASVALDENTAENGCLRLLRGSHRMGRIDHPDIGEANGADPEVLAEAFARMEMVECDLAAGDCVIFHCNTLHASGANPSPRPRTLMHISYNGRGNLPFRPGAWHPLAELKPLPDEALADSNLWGPIDVESLRRPPERHPGERSIYGYRTVNADGGGG
jgi:hypothetical protein